MKSLGNKGDVAQRQRIARRQLSTDFLDHAHVVPKFQRTKSGANVAQRSGLTGAVAHRSIESIPLSFRHGEIWR